MNYLEDVVFGDFVVVVDKCDMRSNGCFDKTLPFFSNGSEFVVGEGENFDEWIWRNC